MKACQTVIKSDTNYIMAERPVNLDTSSVPEWTQINNLTCSTLGSKVLFSTDDWFAAAENLLNPEPAVWKEGFTEQVIIKQDQRSIDAG